MPAKAPSRTNAEHSAETQRRLITAARAEFARFGYANAATERIVSTVGMTRGALYHHYADKRDLFEAVFVELEREIAARIDERASRHRNAFDALIAGCDAWLDACLEQEVQQVVLLDAPAVLGWKRWIEIDSQHGTRLLRLGIDACMNANLLIDVDAATLTCLLSGAMNEAALLLAQSPNAPRLRRTAGRTLHTLLRGLRRSTGNERS